MNEDVTSVFTPAPMISFRSARKTEQLFSQSKTLPFTKNCGLSSVQRETMLNLSQYKRDRNFYQYKHG